MQPSTIGEISLTPETIGDNGGWQKPTQVCQTIHLDAISIDLGVTENHTFIPRILHFGLKRFREQFLVRSEKVIQG